MHKEPEILFTFLTCDTAETEKTFNDATVFSFWGVYKTWSGDYAIHWLDCVEIWVEPKDLQQNFLDFYMLCSRYPIRPSFAAIEKKSTGVTLVSILKSVQGLYVHAVERTKSSGSKSSRFIDCQWHISSGLVSISANARHKEMVIDHMIKITANDSHKRDDIADTAADAIKLALIDKTAFSLGRAKEETPLIGGYQVNQRSGWNSK